MPKIVVKGGVKAISSAAILDLRLVQEFQRRNHNTNARPKIAEKDGVKEFPMHEGHCLGGTQFLL